MQLEFTSFSIDDEDYEGYEYSLVGQLSEVRIVYLNRLVQEVIKHSIISNYLPQFKVYLSCISNLIM